MVGLGHKALLVSWLMCVVGGVSRSGVLSTTTTDVCKVMCSLPHVDICCEEILCEKKMKNPDHRWMRALFS